MAPVSLTDRPPFDPQPLVLTGRHVRLEPLELAHAPDLFEAAQDDRIWAYMPMPRPADQGDIEQMIIDAHANRDRGVDAPFAIVHLETGRAVGATRYLDIRRPDRKLEIGWTWLGVAVQRTPVNTECKYLLFCHAFETLGAIRVFLKTDGRNERSQRAIRRIGATYEGTFRRDRVLWDGYVRDTVYFSILDDEWPDAKRKLEEMRAVRVAEPA